VVYVRVCMGIYAYEGHWRKWTAFLHDTPARYHHAAPPDRQQLSLLTAINGNATPPTQKKRWRKPSIMACTPKRSKKESSRKLLLLYHGDLSSEIRVRFALALYTDPSG
jgi:hypothetical protein